MAATAWRTHDGWFNSLHKADADTDTDAFSIRLYASTSNVGDSTVDAVASVTNELATANGYTLGGIVVALTATETAGVTTVDVADAQWTATGGPIVARYAALIDDTTGLVVAHTLLDDTPADVTATDGNTFTVQINASGVYSVSQP